MTLIVRRLRKPNKWDAAIASGIPTVNQPLPWDLIAEFLPRPDEKGRISTFEIQAEKDLPDLAAALSFGMNSEAERVVLYAVPRVDIDGLGVTIESEKAPTGFPSVDRLHRHLVIADDGTISSLTRLFLAPTIISETPGPVARTQLLKLIKQGQFNFPDLIKEQKQDWAKNPWNHSLAMIVAKKLEVICP